MDQLWMCSLGGRVGLMETEMSVLVKLRCTVLKVGPRVTWRNLCEMHILGLRPEFLNWKLWEWAQQVHLKMPSS